MRIHQIPSERINAMIDKNISNPASLNDDELEIVSGGEDYGEDSVTTVCPKCGSEVCGNPPPLNWSEPVPRRMCICCDYVEW